MHWLGKKWDDVVKELLQNNFDFEYRITSPDGRVAPAGNLRVARVSVIEGRLLFILLHDKFIK